MSDRVEQPMELLQCGRHASPVNAPDLQQDSGCRALHHLKAVGNANSIRMKFQIRPIHKQKLPTSAISSDNSFFLPQPS